MTNKNAIFKKLIEEFNKEFINDHNKGEKRFLRGLFIEEFEAFLKSSLERVWKVAEKAGEEKARKEIWEEGFKKGFNDCKGMIERGEHIHCCVIPGKQTT